MAKKTTTPAPAPRPEPAAAPRAASVPRVKVRATQAGYYGEIYRRPGDVFIIEGPLAKKPKSPEVAGLPAVFSAKWMELVGAHEPERITSHNAALKEEHDAILAGKLEARSNDSSIIGE